MNKIKEYFTGFVTCLILLSLMGSGQVSTLQDQLDKATLKIYQLGILVSEQKQQITELTAQVVDYRKQELNDRIALEPARFASEASNSTVQWLRNPDHLKNVWKWEQKYKYLLTPKAIASAKGFNLDFAIFCWFFSESGYDPNIISYNYQEYNKEYYLKKNGGTVLKSDRKRTMLYDDLILLSTDWYMAQINDVCWKDCYNKLPEQLKKKRKSDPEVAVAMYMLWINSRVAMKWSWCFLSADGWTLVWRLGQIKKENG